MMFIIFKFIYKLFKINMLGTYQRQANKNGIIRRQFLPRLEDPYIIWMEYTKIFSKIEK